MNRESNLPTFDNFETYSKQSEFQSTFRIAASLKLLANLSHAATSYNAVQKVYRTQYDESRSHVRLRDFSMSYQPLYRISERRFNFLGSIKKNSDSFYQPIYLASHKHGPLSSIYAFQSVLDSQTFDFPFRLAIKSDPARYL